MAAHPRIFGGGEVNEVDIVSKDTTCALMYLAGVAQADGRPAAIAAHRRIAAALNAQASAEDVVAWAQRLDDGYDSAESPAYVDFYRKDVVESVIREMRASLGVGK
jgi:hypothetical protein